MATAYAVVSGKGGVGKSTLAANVAAALARMSKRVCLIDMDIGLRSQDVLFGMENQIVYDIVDVLEEVCELRQALLPTAVGVSLLPAAQAREASAVPCAGMEALVSRLRSQFDYVLIDAPAGIGRGYQNAVCAADGALLVTVPEPISLRDAERVKGLLEREGVAKPYLVVNRATWAHTRSHANVSIARCAEILQVPLLGVVPEDARVSALAVDGRLAVGENSQAGRAFERIARRLTGDNTPILYPPKPGLLRRLFLRE